MKKISIIAGLSAMLVAGSVAEAATAQNAPARPAPQAAQPAPPSPGAGMPGMRGMPNMQAMPGMRGDRADQGGGRFADGRGQGRGFRGQGRGPTPQEMQQLMQQRNAALFAELDANKDGRATLQEFQALQERRRLERQRQMFQRFSGGQDSVTLDQLNARTAERFNQGPGRRAAPGAPLPPPAPPAR